MIKPKVTICLHHNTGGTVTGRAIIDEWKGFKNGKGDRTVPIKITLVVVKD